MILDVYKRTENTVRNLKNRQFQILSEATTCMRSANYALTTGKVVHGITVVHGRGLGVMRGQYLVRKRACHIEKLVE